MKKFIYMIILFVFITSTFAGCYMLPSSNDSAATSAPQQSTSIPVQNDAEPVNSQVTIITPVFTYGDADETLADDYILYLQELFKNNGFDVTFDVVYYDLNSAACYEEYFTYLSQNLSKDDTIAFVSGYKMDLLSGYVNIADLSQRIETSAPNYYQYVQRNPIVSQSNNTAITTSISDFDRVTGVLIPNNIASEYSKSLEKSEEYLKFINWAQDRNESLRSSVILTFHDDITSRSNILYDMFLPQQGFIPLGNYFDKTYSLCVDAKKPEKIYDTAKLSFFDDMLENIELSANYSKIVVKHENNAKKDFSEYSSVVMPLEDMSYYSSIADYNFYPPNYTVEILNPDMILERTNENTYVVAADGTQQAGALKLLDWIYSDINNYIVVKYGKAGINYSFDDNEHISLTDAGQQYVDNSPLSSVIKDIEFEASLNSVPSNYLEEINSIEYVKGDNFAKQYENYQNLITTNNYIFDTVNRLTRRWEMTVRALELTTERKVNYAPGTFNFDQIDDLINEIVK